MVLGNLYKKDILYMSVAGVENSIKILLGKGLSRVLQILMSWFLLLSSCNFGGLVLFNLIKIFHSFSRIYFFLFLKNYEKCFIGVSAYQLFPLYCFQDCVGVEGDFVTLLDFAALLSALLDLFKIKFTIFGIETSLWDMFVYTYFVSLILDMVWSYFFDDR